MSKFIKRIQKTVKKNISHCVVVGNDSDTIDYIVSDFSTVFCLSWNTIPPRNKNIIPIQSISFLQNLTDIDIVFINQNFDENVLQFLIPLSKICAPAILLNNNLVLSTEYISFFNRIKYEQVIVLDQYQVWKMIRK